METKTKSINWKRVVIDFLLKRDHYDCALCALPITNFDVFETDHIIPKSQGGIDEIDNFRVVHVECHKRRHQPNMMKVNYNNTEKTGDLKEARKKAEKDYISHILKSNRWNLTKSAKILGISRPTMYDLIKKLEITKPKLIDVD